MRRGQSEALIPMILAVLKAAQCTSRDLAGIGVTIGPGAFTGIRIGIAAARGWGLAAGCAVRGISVFDAIAADCPAEADPLLVAIDSGRGHVFVQAYRGGAIAGAPMDAAPEAVADRFADGSAYTLAGTGAGLVEPHLAGAHRLVAPERPDPATVARLATLPSAPPARPIYIRPPDASPPPAPRGIAS